MANTGTKVMDASKQLSSADRDRMSALDVALYGKAMASEEDVVGSNVDFEDEDWKMMVETAKSGGVGSWFASRVDFRVNGTRIRGKKGYSVSGGVVPLFDGAAIDLKKAKLKAPKQNEAQSDSICGSPDEYQNWVVGTGGQLVLAPFDTQNVVPFRMDQIVVTEKGVMGKSDKSFRFVRGDEEIIGSSLVLRGDYAVLYGVRAEKGNEKEEVHERAAVTRSGLRLYYLPKPEEESGQEESPDVAAESHDRGELTDDSDTQTPPETSGNTTISLLQDIGRTIGAVDTAIGPVQILADLEAGDFSASAETTIATSEEEEPSLGEQVKKSALDKLKVMGQEILTGKRSIQEVSSQILSEAKAVWEELNGDELKEAWKSIPDVCRSFLYENMSEDDVKAFMERLAPSSSLMNLLGMNGDEEMTMDEKKGGGSFPLADISIFPPVLGFVVKLTPGYSFGAYMKGNVHGLYNLWKSEEDKNTEIAFDAGLKGSLSLKASAMLKAGVPYILNLEGGLNAKAALAGSVKDDGTFLSGEITVALKKLKNGEIVLADDIQGAINGGLKLKGSVGASIDISSDILSWQKELYSITFKEWDIAQLNMKLALSKNKSSGDFISGWQLDEASFSAKGIWDKFREGNTEENKYGLFKPEDIDKDVMSGYENAESVFKDALFMLEKMKQGKGKGFIGMEKGPITNASDMELQTQSKFLKAWSEAQINLNAQKERLEKLNSPHYKEYIKKAEDSMKKHEDRLNSMLTYKQQMESSKSAGKAVTKTPMEHYKELAGTSVRGFTRAMKKKAQANVYTYDRILQYEKDRHREKTQKHRERIHQLKRKRAISGGELQKIPRSYKGKAVFNKKALFSTADALRMYEEKRKKAAQAGQDAKIAGLKKYWEDLRAKSGDASKDFMEHYVSTLKKTDEILQYGNAHLLLNYEKDKVEKLAGKSSIVKSLLEVREGKAHGDSKDEIIRRYMERKGSSDSQKTTLEAIFGEDIYRLASADDLIHFEQERIMQHGGLELESFLEIASDRTKTIGDKEIFSSIIKGKSAEQKKKREELKKTYAEWLKGKGKDELMPYLTLDLLLHYERQRIEKSKRKEEHAKRIQWLDSRLMRLDVEEPETARELESKYIQEFFDKFSPSEVIKEIQNMHLVDSKFVLAGLRDRPNQRIEAIENARAKGASSREIWLLYEAAGGRKQEVLEKQKEKLNNNGEAITPEDIERFEGFAVSEQIAKKKRSEYRHWERYEKLSNMMEDGKSYKEMLRFYISIDGGKNYAQHIKTKLVKNELRKEDGSAYTPEDIFAKEEEFKTQLGGKHQTRLALIEANKNKPYRELLALYNRQAVQDGEGLHGKVRKVVSSTGFFSLSTGFEKSLQDVELTPDQIMKYEKMRMLEKGKKHSERLRELTKGKDTLTEEEKEDRARAYMENAKRFKKDKTIQAAVESEEKRLLLDADPEEMYANIMEYETGRKETYSNLVKKLSEPIQETETAITTLGKRIDFCHSVIGNFEEIKSNPELIWKDDKYEQIKKMKDEIMESQKREDEITEIETNVGMLNETITQREDDLQQLQLLIEDEESQGA